jgi:hypothetical protein
MDLLGLHFEQDVLGLFRHVLAISYFTFNGQFYRKTDGVAMGSPLSPVIANFYLVDYEKAGLESVPLKHRCRFRYVDDTFVIWPHGPDKMKDFLYHLNGIHLSILFITKTESKGHLPFLDIYIYGRPDGSLGHKVHCKPTHTNLYHNAKFHHHPSNKQAVLSILVHRARALCDEASLQAELVFLREVFKQNRCNDRQIHRALNRRPHLDQPDKPNSVSRLPALCRDYIQPFR